MKTKEEKLEARRKYAREWAKARRKTHPKPKTEKQKIASSKSSLKWYYSHPEKGRERSWRSNGIKMTCEEYEKRLKHQEYRCAICKTHISDLNKRLTVDHDHQDGQVRGLLCQLCNAGIGFFCDSIESLKEAIKYLEAK